MWLRKPLTKKEVLDQFTSEVLPFVVQQYGEDDKVAIRTAWNDYTDSLCKDGDITESQYNNWTNPF